MRYKYSKILKRSLVMAFMLLSSLLIPLIVRSSIESTVVDTQGIFDNYIIKMSFTITLIVILGLISVSLVILEFLVDEYSLVKLALRVINTLVSLFSLILWSALLVIEILVEGNYISIDLSGVFLITTIFPLLYLARFFLMYRMRRNILWHQVYILNSISQSKFRNLHHLKKNVLDSILKEKKTYFLKNFDALMSSLFESEQPLIKRQNTAFMLTDVGAELLYKYQTIM